MKQEKENGRPTEPLLSDACASTTRSLLHSIGELPRLQLATLPVTPQCAPHDARRQASHTVCTWTAHLATAGEARKARRSLTAVPLACRLPPRITMGCVSACRQHHPPTCITHAAPKEQARNFFFRACCYHALSCFLLASAFWQPLLSDARISGRPWLQLPTLTMTPQCEPHDTRRQEPYALHT